MVKIFLLVVVNSFLLLKSSTRLEPRKESMSSESLSLQPLISVLQIDNHYLPFHKEGELFRFVTDDPDKPVVPTRDEQVAQATAERYAKICGKLGLYQQGPIETAVPLLSIYPQNGNWYPVELYADRKNILVLNGAPLGFNRETAIAVATDIAARRSLDFLSDLGACLPLDNPEIPHDDNMQQ